MRSHRSSTTTATVDLAGESDSPSLQGKIFKPHFIIALCLGEVERPSNGSGRVFTKRDGDVHWTVIE